MLPMYTIIIVVALRKESVDRNILLLPLILAGERSLSARRAWIEIIRPRRSSDRQAVALRKESVDRNLESVVVWVAVVVALRKESVDRNVVPLLVVVWSSGRSPQGERG